MKNLKALSVKLPWALLMFPEFADPVKDIENRDWPTKWLGTIAIHCSKQIEEEEIYFAKHLIHRNQHAITIPTKEELQKYAGKIIGTVDIFDCVQESDSPWFVGEYGFVLKSPRLLKTPIPCRGSLGLWDVFAEETRLINQQLGE